MVSCGKWQANIHVAYSRHLSVEWTRVGGGGAWPHTLSLSVVSSCLIVVWIIGNMKSLDNIPQSSIVHIVPYKWASKPQLMALHFLTVRTYQTEEIKENFPKKHSLKAQNLNFGKNNPLPYNWGILLHSFDQQSCPSYCRKECVYTKFEEERLKVFTLLYIYFFLLTHLFCYN